VQGSALFTGAAGGLTLTVVAFIPVVGAIIGALFSILSFFGGGGDVQKLAAAVSDLATKTATALDQLKRFAWAIGRLALGGLLLLWRAITDMIGELVKAFRSILAALKKIYDDVIKPALRALRAVRKILDDVYRKWLRPIINAIQQVRRILAIFRAFGFKWAGALDARLARIEGKIIAPYIWLVRQLNGYGQWINVILTAGGVLQKPIFRNSAYGNAGYLSNLWWVSQTSGGLGGVSVPDAAPAAYLTLPQVQSQMRQYVQTGTGPYADAAARSVAAAQAASIGA
jgi:hypothetical protein